MVPRFRHAPARELSPDELPWPLKFILIILGYSTVVVPVAVLIYYYKKRVIETNSVPRSYWSRIVHLFAIGDPQSRGFEVLNVPTSPPKDDEETNNKFFKDVVLLLFYFAGIQTTLVLMGFLQERIITQGYARFDDGTMIEKFGDAQFLVFCNRIIALFICFIVLYISWSRQPPHVPPLYVHSYTSFSNTMSSWCQYEALKYVSFPTQTICKASKVVATMFMGRVVRGQRYTWAEYGLGGVIAIGASLFLLSTGGGSVEETTTTTSISGLILMAGYLVFDAFTLNWQKSLFDLKPKVSKYQMMLGVNVFSAILCFVSLLEQGTLFTSTKFLNDHANISSDIFFLSLSGATGQLFIYSTIEKFGPIVFAVIMTIRQMLSILLSSIYYSHPMTIWASAGFMIVFGALFIDIYRRYFEKKTKTHGQKTQA
ncbi:unnamed protein product [Auanema sp. JU1783]|nr:unnamed protein product [Auanema sp. JU1783]